MVKCFSVSVGKEKELLGHTEKNLAGKGFAAGELMNWTSIIGLFAGICTASSLLPQLLKTLKEKKVDEISKGMLIVLMTGVATWIVYGILRNDLPIIATNSFSLLLNITMLFLRFKYSRKK